MEAESVLMKLTKSFLAPGLAGALLVSSLLGPVAAGAAPDSAPAAIDPTLKVHPLLQYGAQAEPNKLVRVIVQLANPQAHSDDLAKSVGGERAEDFKVIPASVLNVTQSAAMQLARNPDVRFVTLDGPTRKHAKADAAPNAGALQTTYPLDVEAPAVWSGAAGGIPATGKGITVAVVDTGLDRNHNDFHLIHRVDGSRQNNLAHIDGDNYGHGTHVASIVGSRSEDGRYIGIAPDARVLGVDVADDNGVAFESDLLRGLDWVYQHEKDQKIRVVNLSVGVGMPESYSTSPIDAAVERLWHDGLVVVAAAGNMGTASDAVFYAPANDPFVITVGCLDDNATPAPGDDTLCSISSRGRTEDGFAKPDVVAPGRKIVGALAAGHEKLKVALAQQFNDRVTPDGQHIRLSGTSMAAPVVSGTVALLLERFPSLTPDQVKSVLTGSTHRYSGQSDNAGAIDALAALQAAAAGAFSASNPGLANLPGMNPTAGVGTVAWDGARWTSAAWDGARWTGTFWDGARWTSAYWDGARWTGAYWDGARWTGAYWDGARWTSAYWDGARWTSSDWDASTQTYD
jgi:serine protease AprX